MLGGGHCPCDIGYYDNGFDSACACKGSYNSPNPITGEMECLPCDPSCAGCTGPLPNQCSLCNTIENRALDPSAL
jgi:hypothetical protein